VKKLAPLNSLHGLSLETIILFVPAMAYLLTDGKQTGAGGLVTWGWGQTC
jgi:EamA domain-containing membrane protein RarD